MTRKRNREATSARIVRPHLDMDTMQHTDRIVSVHRTATGRLGQSTTFITREGDPHHHAHSAPSDPCNFEFFEPPSLSADKPTQEEPPRARPSVVMEWGESFRDSYLDEMMRHEGRGGIEDCADCGEKGLYRCVDCFGLRLLCKTCFVKAHTHLPFHRAQVWTGTFFDDIELKSLGIKVYLGHSGEPCEVGGDLIEDFVIFDVSGVHTVDVHFCGCYGAVGGSHHRIQLLRSGLFPSTHIRPQSAFTFNVLDTFHLLNLQGKISAYDFYHATARKTDNTGTLDTKYRYEQFLATMRIWRHLKLTKRAGRAYDPLGVSATKEGVCAVECPACPHPQRNIPLDWDTKPPHERWLYNLILTVDANFRLKNKEKAFKDDRPLGDGWGHCVPGMPYREYLRKYSHQIEPNLCQSHLQAVDHANTKFSKGYRATGVGGAICARHCLVRKTGLGDLQKGERYANMDFIVMSSLRGCTGPSLTVSYDIACQWSRNFQSRIPQFPSSMQPPSSMLNKIKYVIPKFHIYGHGIGCQTRYSLNYLPYSARTNGEEPERWWAHINPLSMSTREMSPGSRLDTIDDHAAAWNWRKITNFGNSLLSQLREAVEMKAKHKSILAKFTAKFLPEVVQKWVAMIEAWNLDWTKPNPYEESHASTMMADVRSELAKEELEVAKAQGEPIHDVSPNTFLQVGLEIEEQQRLLSQQIKSASSTSNQTADLEGKRATLYRRIQRWQEVQAFYMPAIAERQVDQETSLKYASKPELMPLNLPSGTLKKLWPSEDLATKEKQLRLAQACDALDELRRLLRITMGLWEYKYKQLGPSQRANTRACSLITRFKDKINRVAERYRAARTALLVLDPTGAWSKEFLELKPQDVRAPERGKDDESEGRRAVSWIWLAPSGGCNVDSSTSEEEIHNCLRVEWAKSRARSGRWSEEVKLLVDEMRRVLVFFGWKITWWTGQLGLRSDVRPDLNEGLNAYAAKQSAVLHRLGLKFARQWYPTLMQNGLPVDWPDQFVVGPVSDQLPEISSEISSNDEPLLTDDEPLLIDDDLCD